MEPNENKPTLGDLEKAKVSASSSGEVAVREPENDPKKFLRVFFIAFGAVIVVGALVLLLVFGAFGAGSAEQMTQWGNNAYESGDYVRACGYYEQALAANENSVEARIGLCKVLEAQGKYADMENAALRGIALSPATYEFYAFKVKSMCLMGDLAGARSFMQSIDNSYVLLKVDRNSPGTVRFSPTPGAFSAETEITINISGEGKIHYTVDGSAPTMSSPEYTEPITVKDGAVTVRCFAVSDAGFLTEEVSGTFTVRDDNAAYTFKDNAIGHYVRALLEVSDSTRVTYAMLDKITSLNTQTVHDDSYSVRSLEDLRVFANLSEVHLYGEHNIKDFSVLAALTGLRKLTLCDCGVTDQKLSDIAAIPSCQELDLSDNDLTSLSGLGRMTTLTSLSVQNQKSKLKSVSGLRNLTSLTKLYIGNNALSDLSGISELKAIKELYVNANGLTSLSGISVLTGLQKLDLSGNTLSALSGITALTSLNTLSASGCGLTDISSLSGLHSLKTIDLSNNAIVDFSPLKQTAVTSLSVAGCSLKNISAVTSLSSLIELDISENSIADLSGLAGIPYLKTLNISHTSVTSVATLRGCSALRTVKASGCNLYDADKLKDTSITVEQ